MKNQSFFIALLLILQPMLCFAQLPKVVAVKQFTGIYPASHSLLIPFHGCVELDAQLPEGRGEYWLSLEHLTQDADFTNVEILVNSARTIIGAQATFKGSIEEWRGDRGDQSRKRVLNVFIGGDGPVLSMAVPMAYDAGDFGGMVYTFDNSGHVSWRKSQSYVPVTEEAYTEGQEKHKRECNDKGCKNMTTAARVILPSISISAKEADLDKFREGARSIIMEHIPEANIDKTSDSVIGKFGTMTFQIHHSKFMGHYESDPEPVEGPNKKGFKIHLMPIDAEMYRGDNAIPRSFKSMYWNTYMSVIIDKDKQRYLVYFEYGSDLNEDFKKKIFSLMNQHSEQGNADQ